MISFLVIILVLFKVQHKAAPPTLIASSLLLCSIKYNFKKRSQIIWFSCLWCFDAFILRLFYLIENSSSQLLWYALFWKYRDFDSYLNIKIVEKILEGAFG